MSKSQDTIRFTKEPYVEDVGPRKIKSICFSMLSESDIYKTAEVQVYRGVYYDNQKKPFEGGLLDPHMGPANKIGSCATCRGNFKECPGHYSYLTLTLPVYNVGYLSTILDILKCICKLICYSARWIGNHGFSIGIDDVQPGGHLNDNKRAKILEGYESCNKLIHEYNEGMLKLQPGCDSVKTLEAEITVVLNNIRETAAKSCSRTLFSEKDRVDFLKKMRNPKMEPLKKSGLFKRIVKRCTAMASSKKIVIIRYIIEGCYLSPHCIVFMFAVLFCWAFSILVLRLWKKSVIYL